MWVGVVIAQSVQRCATGWTIGVLRFDSRWGLGIFLFITASRTALGLTQPPIQWVTRALSLGVKWPVREADHSSPSSVEVKECVELYLHSPNTPSWLGTRLKKAQVQLFMNVRWGISQLVVLFRIASSFLFKNSFWKRTVTIYMYDFMRIYWISSRGQTTKGGSPAWGCVRG
jgi:hypothetical protein